MNGSCSCSGIALVLTQYVEFHELVVVRQCVLSIRWLKFTIHLSQRLLRDEIELHEYCDRWWLFNCEN